MRVPPAFVALAISIHALREEGDVMGPSESINRALFLSTPSARRATCCRPPARGLSPISIHALREEGDNKHTVEETKTQ